MWQSRKISHVFNTWTLKQIFWKMQTVFKKLKYSSLVESTKIENITFPYKTALSESNAKTNRMGSTMDLSQKMEFCQFCLFFQFILFQFKNLSKRVDLSHPNVLIHTFRKCRSFISGCFFLWVSLSLVRCRKCTHIIQSLDWKMKRPL